MAGSNCVFCDIVANRFPAWFLYRDSTACSFLDVEPVRARHSLVVPNKHVVDLIDDGAATALTGMAEALQFTATLLKKRLQADGVSIFQPTALRQARASRTFISTWCLAAMATVNSPAIGPRPRRTRVT